MKRLGIIVLGIFVVAALLVYTDGLSARSTAARARTIRHGDTKQHVEQILGRPTSIFTPLPEARTNLVAALLSVGSETWAYGKRLDLRQPFHSEFPYFIPVRLRLFQPDADDVVIEFDSAGSVTKVTIP